MRFCVGLVVVWGCLSEFPGVGENSVQSVSGIPVLPLVLVTFQPVSPDSWTSVAVLPCRNDGTEFGGSIYQKVNKKLETAVNLAWTAGNSNTRFGIAAKYQVDPDACFSVGTHESPGSRLREFCASA